MSNQLIVLVWNGKASNGLAMGQGFATIDGAPCKRRYIRAFSG
jgi:hypothetical protein